MRKGEARAGRRPAIRRSRQAVLASTAASWQTRLSTPAQLVEISVSADVAGLSNLKKKEKKGEKKKREREILLLLSSVSSPGSPGDCDDDGGDVIRLRRNVSM